MVAVSSIECTALNREHPRRELIDMMIRLTALRVAFVHKTTAISLSDYSSSRRIYRMPYGHSSQESQKGTCIEHYDHDYHNVYHIISR